MKCKIQWIDPFNNPTPDYNDAIGLAVCYDPTTFGPTGSGPWPICYKHAIKKGKWWKICPPPGLIKEWWHSLVLEDESFKIVPQAVIDSVKLKYAEQPFFANDVLNDLKYDHLNKCWYFNRGGIYHGIEEKDGYIHT